MSPRRQPPPLSKAPSRSGRLLVAQFAAHLAYLLNTGDPSVSVKTFALYQRLLQTLAGEDYRHLVGTTIVGGGRSEEVAQKYFEAVLERRLHIARANDTHKGHELFLALCRRGRDPLWPPAVLRRRKDAQRSSTNVAAPHDFHEVCDRVGRLDTAISPGNPAANTREHRGTLHLEAGGGRAEVPEELSIWQAIVCAPNDLNRLAAGAEFNAFCSLVIKALEAANAPFGAYLALGLSPFDWAEDLSVNTAKKLSVFLSDVRAETGNSQELDGWRRAWKRRQVPGYDSADALWHSELGRALRLPQISRTIDTIDIDDLPDPEQGHMAEPEVLDPAGFAERLALCRAAGVIDDFDVWLYREIEAGKDIDDLAQTPEMRRRYSGQTTRLVGYLGDLTERVLGWVNEHLKAEDGISRHPDNDDNVA